MNPSMHETPNEHVPTRRDVILWSVIGFLMVGVIGLGAYRLNQRQPVEPLPVIGRIPSFSLIERTGERVDLTAFERSIWVADFIFTRCSGPCLRMSANMERIQTVLAGDPRVKFASFSVDPEWDTPEVLTKYAENYHADPDRWLFMTGSFDEIQKLAREGFLLSAEAADAAAALPIVHSDKLVLVDAAGRIRGYYDGTDPASVRLVTEDVRRLLAEGPLQ